MCEEELEKEINTEVQRLKTNVEKTCDELVTLLTEDVINKPNPDASNIFEL